MTVLPLAARGATGSRRLVALGQLLTLAALVTGVLLDASPTVRLPLALIVVLTAPGTGLLGLTDLERTSTWWAMVVATSLALATLVATALAAGGWLRAETFVAALAALCTPGLAVQIVGRRAR